MKLSQAEFSSFLFISQVALQEIASLRFTSVCFLGGVQEIAALLFIQCLCAAAHDDFKRLRLALKIFQLQISPIKNSVRGIIDPFSKVHIPAI